MNPGRAEHDASEAVRLKMKDFWPRLATFNFTESPERILQPRTIVAKDSRWGSFICFKMVPSYFWPQVMITSRLYTLQEGVTFLSTVRFQCSCYLSRLQWMFTLKRGAYIAVSLKGPVCEFFFRKPTWQLVSYLVHHGQTGFIIKWRCKMAAS